MTCLLQVTVNTNDLAVFTRDIGPNGTGQVSRFLTVVWKKISHLRYKQMFSWGPSTSAQYNALHEVGH